MRIVRELRFKLFLGSTTEEIEEKVNEFLVKKEMCPGNYVTHELDKLGDVYQLAFFYAEVRFIDDNQ